MQRFDRNEGFQRERVDPSRRIEVAALRSRRGIQFVPRGLKLAARSRNLHTVARFTRSLDSLFRVARNSFKALQKREGERIEPAARCISRRVTWPRPFPAALVDCRYRHERQVDGVHSREIPIGSPPTQSPYTRKSDNHDTCVQRRTSGTSGGHSRSVVSLPFGTRSSETREGTAGRCRLSQSHDRDRHRVAEVPE